MPALAGFSHSWKKFLEWKSPWADSVHQKISSVDAVRACTSSEPFPDARSTWGRCIYEGLGSAVVVQRSSSNSGAELGWCLLLTSDQGFCSQIIFQGRHTFSWRTSLVLQRQPARQAPSSCVGLSMLGLCSPASLALLAVPHPVGRWHPRCVLVVCLTAGSAGLGVTVLAPNCGTAGHWDRCALRDWETVGSAMLLPWVTREMQWIVSLDLSCVLPREMLTVGCPCSSSKELLPPGKMTHTDPFSLWFSTSSLSAETLQY